VDGGATETHWFKYQHGWSHVRAEVIGEILLGLYVNGQEFASIMCTPLDQSALALGFLKNEGLLERMEQVEALTVSRNGCCVDVWLDHAVQRPRREILTSAGRCLTAWRLSSSQVTPSWRSWRLHANTCCRDSSARTASK
jgi:formate dehydrogenase accessory protein FdhD